MLTDALGVEASERLRTAGRALTVSELVAFAATGASPG
jgi:hypothetical protein